MFKHLYTFLSYTFVTHLNNQLQNEKTSIHGRYRPFRYEL